MKKEVLVSVSSAGCLVSTIEPTASGHSGGFRRINVVLSSSKLFHQKVWEIHHIEYSVFGGG